MKHESPISDGKIHDAIPIKGKQYQAPIGESENEIAIPSSFTRPVTFCSTDELADRMIKDVWDYHENKVKCQS